MQLGQEKSGRGLAKRVSDPILSLESAVCISLTVPLGSCSGATCPSASRPLEKASKIGQTERVLGPAPWGQQWNPRPPLGTSSLKAATKSLPAGPRIFPPPRLSSRHPHPKRKAPSDHEPRAALVFPVRTSLKGGLGREAAGRGSRAPPVTAAPLASSVRVMPSS